MWYDIHKNNKNFIQSFAILCGTLAKYLEF